MRCLLLFNDGLGLVVLQERARSSLQNAALSLSLIVRVLLRHLDETVVTPRSPPRVLDQVIGIAILALFRVTNRENAVINFRATLFIEYSFFVELECCAIGLDGNADRLGADGFHQISIGMIHINERSHFGVWDILTLIFDIIIGIILLATSQQSGPTAVGVVLLRAQTTAVLIKEEGTVHQTATASLVLLAVAIDQLLNGEGLEISGVKEPGSFDGTNGRERPARAAHTLILHLGDGALIGPIHVLGKMMVLLLLIHLIPKGILGGHATASRRRLGVGLGDGSSAAVLAQLVQLLELIVRHVRVRIVAQSVRWLGNLVVVLLDEGCGVRQKAKNEESIDRGKMRHNGRGLEREKKGQAMQQ